MVLGSKILAAEYARIWNIDYGKIMHYWSFALSYVLARLILLMQKKKSLTGWILHMFLNVRPVEGVHATEGVNGRFVLRVKRKIIALSRQDARLEQDGNVSKES